ncbi:MAG: hypothetical protein ACRCSV_02230 [Chlamydiales bacterium]
MCRIKRIYRRSHPTIKTVGFLACCRKIRNQCELLCKQKCIYEINTILSKLPEDLMQPLLQTFEEEIEKTYQQILALRNTEEFELLKDWSQNHLNQFLSVFIEEEDGKIKESFPKLFKLFLLTQDAFVSKKKPKKSTYTHKKTGKKLQKEITPQVVREKLLRIITQAPAVEISSLDMIKFLSIKNAMNPKSVNFRDFWKVLKHIHYTYDKIESDKRDFLLVQENLSQESKKVLKMVQKLQKSEHLRPELEKVMESFKEAEEKQKKDKKKRSLDHFNVKERIKTHFLENSLPSSRLFTEIILIKMKNSSFFDRTIEASFLRSYVKDFPQTGINVENDEIIYGNLLQELEKIQSKNPSSKNENFL